MPRDDRSTADRRRKPPTKREYREAIKRHHGLLSIAARSLGVNRRSIYRAIERWPDLKDEIDEAREFTVDTAEGKLYAAIAKGEAWAIRYFLQTIGKDRGYIEAREHRHSGSIDLHQLTDEELEAIARGVG
jgi:hypothetical protein